MTSPLGILFSFHNSASAPVKKKKLLRHPSILAFNIAKTSLWCSFVRQLGQCCLTVQAPSTTGIFTSLAWLMEPKKSEFQHNGLVSVTVWPWFLASVWVVAVFPLNSRSRLMTESSIIYGRCSCCMPVTPRWMIRSSRVVWVPWNEAAAPLRWSSCCCCWLPFHFQGWAKNRKAKIKKNKKQDALNWKQLLLLCLFVLHMY